MNTVVTLDLDEVRSAGTAAPSYAVADVIPIRRGSNEPHLPTLGLVLELKSRRSLERRIEVGEGTVLVNVRFPTGELLSQRVEVRASTESGGSLSFVVPSRRKAARVREIAPGAYETPREVLHRGPSTGVEGHGDRSHWGVVKVAKPIRDGATLHDALRSIAVKAVGERQAGQGMTRVQSFVREQATLPRSSDGLQSSEVVGEVVALQPVKLYGDEESLHTQWKLPLRSKKLLGSPEDEGRRTRFFALAYQSANDIALQQVACVPGRWKRSDQSWATLRISYDSAEMRDNRQARVRIDIDDPEVGVMLQYLQTGDIESSYALFEKAFEGLRGKFTNPYAAAAGAYVLLYSGMRTKAESWSQWVHNLATEFRTLPDGMILLGTLYLQTPAGEAGWLYEGQMTKAQVYQAAFEASMEAVRRGPPLYRHGLLLLSANLQILSGALKDGGQLRQISRATKFAQALSLRADPSQPFCVLDVADDEMLNA